jgi:hypothetical protein
VNDLDLERRLRRTCDAVADRTVVTPHHQALRQFLAIDDATVDGAAVDGAADIGPTRSNGAARIDARGDGAAGSDASFATDGNPGEGWATNETVGVGRAGANASTRAIPSSSPGLSGPERPGPGRRPPRPATRGWRTTVVGIAATLLILAGGVALMRLGRDGEATTRADEGSGVGRWEELPAPPVEAFGAGRVWTGTELVALGGFLDRPMTDTLAYDPARRSWRRLADLPAELAGASIAVWTGHEAVAIATSAPGKAGIYDPGTDEWRVVADPAIPTMHAESHAFWTGDKVLLAGVDGAEPNDLGRGAVLYDPSTGEWQVLPEAPQPLSAGGDAVWTGREMVLVGQPAREPGDTGSGGLVALALDPAAGRWRVLPAPPLSERGDPLVVWTGTELVVAGGIVWPDDEDPGSVIGARDAVVLDMATETWAPYPALPVGVSGNYVAANPTVAAIGRQVVVLSTFAREVRPVVLDTATRTWQLGAPPPDSFPETAHRIAIPAGGEVLVRAYTEATGDDPESPHTTFSYTPPP